VSDEPTITDANREVILSAPYFSNISAKTAFEPPPENGRIKISGRAPLGTPSLEKSGSNKLDNISVNPDAESIDTDTTSIISVGRSEKHVDMPSRVPRRKSSADVFFEKTVISAVKVMISGANIDATRDITAI